MLKRLSRNVILTLELGFACTEFVGKMNRSREVIFMDGDLFECLSVADVARWGRTGDGLR